MVDFVKLMALGKLKDATKKCTACSLHLFAKAPVPCEGGSAARIMVMGDAPGEAEDEEGHPFVGRSGQILRDAIAKAGIKQQVLITDVVRCRPPKQPGNPHGGVRPPNNREVKTCFPLHTVKELELLEPAVIVVLGDTAAQVLLNTDREIGDLRRDPRLTYGDTKSRVLADYHPAYLLRMGQPKKQMDHLVLTLKRAAKIADNSRG